MAILAQAPVTIYQLQLNKTDLSHFNATILKFYVEFDHPFSHVFIFGNMFPESYSSIAVPVTKSDNFVSLH